MSADREIMRAALDQLKHATAEIRARLDKPRAPLGQWPQRAAAYADLIERLARL